MIKTTLGQILINDALPPTLRDYSRRLDKKGTSALFQEIVDKHPDQYREIAKKLSDIGRRTATEFGGYSFGIDDLQVPENVNKMKIDLQNRVDKILSSRLPGDQKHEAVIELLRGKAKEFEDAVYTEAVKNKNPLAMQVISGSRGNPGNIKSIIGGDLLYEDQAGRILPVPILKGYAQGLSPVNYFAGSYGARKGVVDVKQATQDAGAFGKQLNQVTHRLVVTAMDADEPEENVRGMPVDTEDESNEGALLALPVGNYRRNQILTPKILSDLKAKGHDRILIRSPITGGPRQGGLYSADVGVRERGGLSPIGDFVGMAASQALSEKLSQAQLASKHAGGVAGKSTAVSGFKYINQLAQVPKVFPGGAAHAQVDGKVAAIYDAPAGGKYLMIAGKRHFVRPGFEIKVKPGQIVEAGDVLSDGLPNPAEIVTHKGVGEGRRYFVDLMKKVYSDSGLKAHRRNIELLARGLINHVQLTEEMGDYLPDDVISYNTLEHAYKPREGHAVVPPKNAVGKYLERPVLHHSIGTRIQPSMLKDFDHFGIKHVIVHHEPPPFQPIMIRAMENLAHDPDFMSQQLGTNLKKSLLTSTHRGRVSNELGTSFVPGLARAVDFGRAGATKTWDPKTVQKVNLHGG